MEGGQQQRANIIKNADGGQEPAMWDLCYVYVEGGVVKRSPVHREFDERSKMSRGLKGRLWVQTPITDGSSDKAWRVYHCREIKMQVKMYDRDDVGVLMENGRRGIWPLIKIDEDDENSDYKLMLQNCRNINGIQVHGRIPKGSKMIYEKEGGLFLYVPLREDGELPDDAIAPGLWYFDVFAEATHLIDDLPEKCLVESDGT